MPLLTLTLTQETILNELRDYNEPMTADELVSLGSLKKSSILYALNKLIKKKVVFKKRKVKKGNKYYYFTKHKGIDSSSILNKSMVKEETRKKPPSTPTKQILKEMDIQQRCYHLLMAGRSLSSGRVSDFFNVSEDRGVRLLRGLAKKYPNEIKIDIMAKVI